MHNCIRSHTLLSIFQEFVCNCIERRRHQKHYQEMGWCLQFGINKVFIFLIVGFACFRLENCAYTAWRSAPRLLCFVIQLLFLLPFSILLARFKQNPSICIRNWNLVNLKCLWNESTRIKKRIFKNKQFWPKKRINETSGLKTTALNFICKHNFPFFVNEKQKIRKNKMSQTSTKLETGTVLFSSVYTKRYRTE